MLSLEVTTAAGAEVLRGLFKYRAPHDEKYDKFFPDHPLSKVRRRIREVMATLELDASLQSLTPFRIRRAWRFWR